MMMWQTESTTPEYTESLAEKLGRALRGGEVIELVSDLGGGKTTFTKGLARGIDSQDKVASPTFTISKMYKGPKLEMHHFDFYRLHEAGIIANEIEELVGDPRVVVVIEWADAVRHVLSDQRVTITIKQTPSGTREMAFHIPESLNYLLEAVKR